MQTIQSKTVVFIHGAFVSNAVWDNMRAYFESRGYNTIAPPWPHKDAPADVLRSRHPDSAIASIRLQDLLDTYTNVIQKLPEKPIIIGFSAGGLVAQLLIQRGLGAAGVAMHAVAPKGVLTFEFSALKATIKSFGFFSSTKKSYMMTFKDWQYAFANGMTLEEQKASYEKYAVPESKKLVREGLSDLAAVDFKKWHVPLLIVAGTEDHTVPASWNYSMYKRYKKGNKESVTDFISFGGRNHLVLGQPTWQEEADFILQWIEKH